MVITSAPTGRFTASAFSHPGATAGTFALRNNDRGDIVDIVGWQIDSDGASHGFVASPR
jgi:hypothetical protein